MEISATDVKELRERTGVGIMDCKKALQDAEGDMEEAVSILRKMGKAKAAKRAGREASEGRIESYVHMGGKIAVLVELNCETDFVARSDEFSELARDLAMHVAAASPTFVTRDEIGDGTLQSERQVYAEQAKAEGKPEEIVEKIVEGKMNRYYQEVCLLEQPFVKDPDKRVRDLLTEAIAKLGENILVSRFVRFALGDSDVILAVSDSPEE